MLISSNVEKRVVNESITVAITKLIEIVKDIEIIR